MKSHENCKKYRILAEHEDDSPFVMEYEHKKKGIVSQHTHTEFHGTVRGDTPHQMKDSSSMEKTVVRGSIFTLNQK